MAKAQGIASGVLTITINRACPLLLLWPESSIKSDQSKHLCQEIPSEQAHQAWQNNDTMVYSSQVARKFMCYFLYPQFLVDHFTFHIQNTNLFKIWNRICFTETVPLLLVLLRKNLGSQLFLMWKTWSRCPGRQQMYQFRKCTNFFLKPKDHKKNCSPDKFSVMTYLAQFYHKFNEQDPDSGFSSQVWADFEHLQFPWEPSFVCNHLESITEVIAITIFIFIMIQIRPAPVGRKILRWDDQWLCGRERWPGQPHIELRLNYDDYI